MTEQWLPSPVFGETYEVSSIGRVRRAARAQGTVAGRVLRPYRNPRTGRRQVVLSLRQNKARVRVATLVAGAFLGPCPIGREINHIDGDKTNDAAANLEYMTRRENYDHAQRLGLYAVGERQGSARLTEQSALEIIRLHQAGMGRGVLGQRFGIHPQHAYNIAVGKRWAHLPRSIEVA